MSSRGKKDCPGCNTEIGARSILCISCGYHFPTGEIRKDLIKEKEEPKPIFYNEIGKGRKQCPTCSSIIGGVTRICPKCSYDFSSARKEKEETKEGERKEKEEVKDRKRKEIQEIKEAKKKKKEVVVPVERSRFTAPEYKAPKKLSPEEHANRILEYGVERATNLLKQFKNKWIHVNWEIVKEGLKK